MKKFKNKLAVKGSKSLLKAFEEELKELGYSNYEKDPEEERYYPIKVILVNRKACGNGTYFHQATYLKENYNYDLTLPQDWNKALELAAEVIEEIPKYVECIKGYSDQFTKGKIYQVDIKYSDSSTYLFIKDDKGSTTNGWSAVNFKPSTKEAFEEQNKPKFKEGDWLYRNLTNSELIFKFKEIVNNKCNTNEYYQLTFDNRLIGEGCDNFIAPLDNVRLATDEEIKRILLKVAEIKYPIGTKFKSAYDDIPDGISNGIFKIYNKDTVTQSGQTINDSYRYVYYKGKWAEIIVDPKIVINGHEVVKIDEDIVKVGCQEFYVSHIRKMISLFNAYGGTYVFKDNTKWTANDLDKILSGFDN